VLFEVEEHYLLGNTVKNVFGGGAAALAGALLAAQFLGQAAQARYAVGAKDVHV
jgi:hypothetical protein